MYLKVDIPEHFQFRIVRSLKDMLLRKETEIHYIGGAEVLPPPLPAKEEMECIGQLVKEQSETARKKLIEHNLRLVVYIAKKFDNTGVGVEDLISIGTIGLIKAINTFNPEKNIKLATYASRCIENEILMTFRAGKKYAKDISLYDPIGVDKDGETVSRMDVLEAEGKEVLETIILKQEIEQLYRAYEACLKETEKIVLRSRYGLFGGKEQTQREIAARLGISRSYVSRIEKRALEKMRRGFAEHK